MDYPYEAVRRSGQDVLKRAQFRFLLDAMAYVNAVIVIETSPCMWTVHNVETGHLCARWRYEMGQVKRIV